MVCQREGQKYLVGLVKTQRTPPIYPRTDGIPVINIGKYDVDVDTFLDLEFQPLDPIIQRKEENSTSSSSVSLMMIPMLDWVLLTLINF